MFKLIVAFALVVVVNCDGYETVVPSALEQPTEQSEDSSQPKYTFTYEVHDSVSGDSKNHIETRNGDVVQGEYSLIDADGFKRTVKYTADDANGFNAVVDRKPITSEVSIPVVATDHGYAQQPAVVKNIAPVTYSASTVAGHIPVTYIYSPIVKTASTHVAYSSGKVVYRSFPLSYNSPGFIESPQVSYTQFHPSLVPIAAVRGGW